MKGKIVRFVKKKFILSIVVTFLLSTLLVVSCAQKPVKATDAIDKPGTGEDQAISSPEMARDATIAYLREDNSSVPSSHVSWAGENISSEDAVATENFLYTFRDWTISVVSPEVKQENKVFTVIVRNEENGFDWAGLVDSYGKIIKYPPPRQYRQEHHNRHSHQFRLPIPPSPHPVLMLLFLKMRQFPMAQLLHQEQAS